VRVSLQKKNQASEASRSADSFWRAKRTLADSFWRAKRVLAESFRRAKRAASDSFGRAKRALEHKMKLISLKKKLNKQ